MMNKVKRLMACLITLIMLFNTLPIPAIAAAAEALAGDKNEESVEVVDDIVEVSSKPKQIKLAAGATQHTVTIINNTGSSSINLGDMYILFMNGSNYHYEKIDDRSVYIASSFHALWGDDANETQIYDGNQTTIIKLGDAAGQQKFKDWMFDQSGTYHVYASGDTITDLNTNQTYPLTINTDQATDTTTITIGNVGSIPHSASINGLLDSLNDNNYSIVATVGGSQYAAQISGNGTVFFSGNEAVDGKLPDAADQGSVKIVHAPDLITQVDQIVDANGTVYSISGPVLNTSTHDYAFTATPREEYTADFSTEIESFSGYYVVAIQDGNPISYAPLTNGNLTFSNGISVYNDTTFIVVKADSIDLSNLNSISADNKATASGDTIDDIQFTWTADSDTKRFHFVANRTIRPISNCRQAQIPRTCT